MSKILKSIKKTLLDNQISDKIKKDIFSKKILSVPESKPDERDWLHEHVKFTSPELKEFSRRDLTPKVLDQGSIGSCVGHSGRVLLSSSELFQVEESSPMWIYKKGKEHDVFAGEDYSGTTIRGAAKAVQKEGCCFERF